MATPPLRVGVLAFNTAIADAFAASLKDPKQSVILPGSPEQEAIFTAIVHGTTHVVVKARAGTGKSWTLKQAILRLKRLRQAAMVQVAATTYNSHGWRAVRNQYRGIQLDKDNQKLGHHIAETLEDRYGLDNLGYAKGEIIGAVRKLVAMCKYNLLDGKDAAALAGLAAHHNITFGTSREIICDTVPLVLTACDRDTGTADYDDQCWFAVQHHLPVEPYDLLLVDEAQDTNRMQQEMAMLACPTGRVVIVGDVAQAIYGFRGGDVTAIPRMRDRLAGTYRGVTEYPLTVTRRNPTSHVALVQGIVPDIQAMSNAPKGIIDCPSEAAAARTMRPGDLVICRTNAPLVSFCYQLLQRNVKAIIRGKDASKELVRLIEKLKAGDDVRKLLEKLHEYRAKEAAKLMRLKDAGLSKLATLNDTCECVIELTSGINSVSALKQKIERIFADFEADGAPKDAVVLSSVHKAKGLEAFNVYILKPELLPHPSARQEWEVEQEHNLAYVAATRGMYSQVVPDALPGRLAFVQGDKSNGIPAIYTKHRCDGGDAPTVSMVKQAVKDADDVGAALKQNLEEYTGQYSRAEVEKAAKDWREGEGKLAAQVAKKEVARRFRVPVTVAVKSDWSSAVSQEEMQEAYTHVQNPQPAAAMLLADGTPDDLWDSRTAEDYRADAECFCKWRGDKLVESADCPVHGGVL